MRSLRLNTIVKPLILIAAAGLLMSCAGEAGTAGPAGEGCKIADGTDGSKTITCADGTTATISDGKPGDACTIKDNGDGTKTVDCGGKTVTLKDGTEGKAGKDGKPCTVTDNKDGTYLIDCADGTKVTLSDGKEGAAGKEGTTGKEGAAGKDAAPCNVKDNGDGTKTITCGDGTKVTVKDGMKGVDGEAGGNSQVRNFHGTDHLHSTGEFADAGKFYAKATITKASADDKGVAMVEFKVEDEAKAPVATIKSINASIVKLVPPSGGESFSKWVSYHYRTETAKNSAKNKWKAKDGDTALQAYRENKGTFTNNGDGSYKYVFAIDLTKAMRGTEKVAYDRKLTHRVNIMFGGHSGPTADAYFDFVPEGGDVKLTKDIILTDACKSCHGTEFHGHGGDRLSVGTCVTCHNPGNLDAQSGETLDMKVMIHKIHAGGELASIPGKDGIVWDDPATTVDESADNGDYTLWGYKDRPHTWWKVGFPAVIQNCTKCHDGKGKDGDSWKKVPSRDACGSCHDDVDFKTGVGHKAGKAEDDSKCAVCHTPSGDAGKSVVDAHEWWKKDERNIPEYDVKLTVSEPANKTHFVKGEAPLVTLVLTDAVTKKVVDHTTVAQEDASKEGCNAGAPCPAGDGLLSSDKLMVHGPRGDRKPVLTTAARAQIISKTSGPWDLSGAKAFTVVFDNGGDVNYYDVTGGDKTWSGTIKLDPTKGKYADAKKATATELMTFLMDNTGFAARGIAWVEKDGKLGIRSRNLGHFYSVQLPEADTVTNGVFGGDMSLKRLDAYYVYAHFAKATTSKQHTDPKAAATKDSITYQLDPVDDLKPGTYVVSVEIQDRGRINGSDYKTPSVAVVTFNVGQATEEKAPAGNCGSCHMSDVSGKGFVLDWGRHNKIFNDTAIDQCGACHDYLSRSPTGDWDGAKAMSKRIHGIHTGSSLNFPLKTVWYGSGDPIKGRNWDITLPQDARNCEACHTKDKNSTSWYEKPNGLACSGCHDSIAAEAHIKQMTYDPTPTNPWSGDEKEACKTCH